MFHFSADFFIFFFFFAISWKPGTYASPLNARVEVLLMYPNHQALPDTQTVVFSVIEKLVEVFPLNLNGFLEDRGNRVVVLRQVVPIAPMQGTA